jgi:hypothetical protein
MVLMDERICLGCLLSCRPIGVMEDEQFVSRHSVLFPSGLIVGFRSMTALEFSRRTNKNIEGIPMFTRPIEAPSLFI